jgi:hypothetical protein
VLLSPATHTLLHCALCLSPNDECYGTYKVLVHRASHTIRSLLERLTIISRHFHMLSFVMDVIFVVLCAQIFKSLSFIAFVSSFIHAGSKEFKVKSNLNEENQQIPMVFVMMRVCVRNLILLILVLLN